MLPYSEVIEELVKKDPFMKNVLDDVEGEIDSTPSIDVYYYLLHSIVSQQLSTKVADIIWQRFLDLFPDQYPDERELLMMEDITLRNIGLSRAKLGYMKNVADFSLTDGMLFDKLDPMTDEEIIKYLTQIKGVGKWTVQMILMFPMDRPNVFPVDDLGIQTKMKKYYELDLEKAALKRKLVEIAEIWSPYKTMASKLLWAAGQ
jgi:DNA-3-methyladenine glycosylase II